MPALAFIWSAAGVVSCTLVWAASGCVFPLSSSSTHEPGRHKVHIAGVMEKPLSLLCLGAIQTAPCIPRTNTPLSPVSMEMADPYISCTTDTGWDARCIHACISLCHCPTNSLHIFLPRRSNYIIYKGQGSLPSMHVVIIIIIIITTNNHNNNNTLILIC